MQGKPDIVKIVLASISVTEAYRLRAEFEDVYALSGREGRPDSAQFVARRIVDVLDLQHGQCVVDVGCGEGTLLKLAVERAQTGEFIGILPTQQEVERANRFLEGGPVAIQQGLADATGLASEGADRVVMNGVLLLLPNPERAIAEVARIARKGALVFIGETPAIDQYRDKRFNSSLLHALGSALRHGGPIGFFKVLSFIVTTAVKNGWHSMAARKVFWISPRDFEKLAGQYGLELLSAFPHVHLKPDGTEVEDQNRMNYLLRRL